MSCTGRYFRLKSYDVHNGHLGVKTVFAFAGLIKLVSAACIFSFCAQEDGLLFFGGLDEKQVTGEEGPRAFFAHL